MRCHTSCCSWKTRPPFSTSAQLLCVSSVIHHSFALSWLLCRALSLSLASCVCVSPSGDSPLLVYRSLGVQGAPSIHSARVRLPGWVTMATHSLRLCHVNSNPSSSFPPLIPSPFWLQKKKMKKKSVGLQQKTTPWTVSPGRTRDTHPHHTGKELRGCWWFCFPPKLVLSSLFSPPSLLLLLSFPCLQQRQLCVVSSRWAPAEKKKQL